MEPSPSPPKSYLAHIVGAIAVTLMGAVRVLDDCGRAGMAMGRSADDVASAGARFGGSADELAGGARFGRGADELAGGARLGHGADPLTGPGWGALDDVPHASASEPNDLLETVVEGGAELALEVMDVPLDEVDEGGQGDQEESDGEGVDEYAPAGGRPVALTVMCPARTDLGAEPERWQRFVTTGYGSACAPHLVFGRAVPGSPETLAWGSQQRTVEQVATDCWNAGTTCIIVACDDDCAERMAAIPNSTRDMDGGLAHYTAVLTRAVIAMDPKPRVVAVVRGDRAPQMQMIVR